MVVIDREQLLVWCPHDEARAAGSGVPFGVRGVVSECGGSWAEVFTALTDRSHLVVGEDLSAMSTKWWRRLTFPRFCGHLP